MRSAWIAMLMISSVLAHDSGRYDNDHHDDDHNGWQYSAGMFELLALIILICVCVWCMLPSDVFTAMPSNRCCEVRIEPHNMRRGGPGRAVPAREAVAGDTTVTADDPYAVPAPEHRY